MKHLRPIVAGLVGAAVAAGVLLAVRPLLNSPRPSTDPTPRKEDPPPEPFVVIQDPDSNATSAPATSPLQEVVTEARIEADEQRRQQEATYVAQLRRRREADAKRAALRDRIAARDARVAETRSAPTTRPDEPPTTAPQTQPAEPTTVPDLLTAGDRALAEGKNRQAEDYFRKALETQPKNVDALGALAMALLAERDFKASIPVYQELISLLPDARQERANLALAYARCGMYRQAESTYRDLLRDYPDLLEARVNYAIMLYQDEGKLSDALAQWQQVVKQDKTLYDAHQALGEIYTDLNQPRDALLAFAEAAKLRPRLPGAWLNVAAAAEGTGDGGVAALAYEQALKLAPYDADVWRRQGDLHLQLWRLSEQRAQKTNALAKGDSTLLRKAVESWRKSMDLDPDQADLRDVLKTYEPLAGLPATNAPAP